MNIARFPQRVEIAFWTAAIQVMEEASVLRRLIQTVYAAVDRFQKASLLKLMVYVTGAGLLLGFIYGYLFIILG